MSNTSVRNILVESAITLPSPYNRILQSGDTVIIGDSVANVLARFGGGAAVSRCLAVSVAPDNAVPTIAANGGQPDAQLYPIDNAVAAAVASVHAAVAESAANQFPGPFTNPTVPRNISVTFAAGWQGGDVTVFGTDQFDAQVSEVVTSTPGMTIAGTKIFKTVTAAAKAAVAGTVDAASIGVGNKLGVTPMMSGAQAVLLTDGAIEAATVDAANSAFTPTTAPNGVHDYLLIYNA